MRLNLRLMGLLHGILIIGMLGYFVLRMSLFLHLAHADRRARRNLGGEVACGPAERQIAVSVSAPGLHNRHVGRMASSSTYSRSPKRYVGFLVDFHIIAASPGPIVLLTVGVVAVKMAVLFGIGRAGGLSLDQNLVMSVGLSQVGEFAFVLLSFIAGLGLLDATSTGSLYGGDGAQHDRDTPADAAQ